MLFLQIFPICAVAALLQMVRIQDMVELGLHREGKIWLAEIQSLTHQRKACVSDDGFACGQVAQKLVHARFLEENISLLTFLPKAISDELAPHFAQQLDQVRGRGSHIHKHMLALPWLSCQDLAADDRRESKRIWARGGPAAEERTRIKRARRGHHAC